MNAPAAHDIFEIEMLSDVPYGEGSIGFGTPHPSSRPLTLDIYKPLNTDRNALKPALILSHGLKDPAPFQRILKQLPLQLCQDLYQDCDRSAHSEGNKSR